MVLKLFITTFIFLLTFLESYGGLVENKTSSLCPCLQMDKCPRVFGESAMDVRELGFVEPCHEFGTVRCCGVAIRTEPEKDVERKLEGLKDASTPTATTVVTLGPMETLSKGRRRRKPAVVTSSNRLRNTFLSGKLPSSNSSITTDTNLALPQNSSSMSRVPFPTFSGSSNVRGQLQGFTVTEINGGKVASDVQTPSPVLPKRKGRRPVFNHTENPTLFTAIQSNSVQQSSVVGGINDANSNFDTKSASNSNFDTESASKSRFAAKSASNSNLDNKSASNSNFEAKSANSNVDINSASNSNLDTKPASNSNFLHKLASNSNFEQNSASNSNFATNTASNSNFEPNSASSFNLPTKSASNSNFGRNSVSDSNFAAKSANSNFHLKSTSNSNFEAKSVNSNFEENSASSSNLPTKPPSNSNFEPKSANSNFESNSASSSNLPPKSALNSNFAANSASDSNSQTKSSSNSNFETNSASNSNFEPNSASNSNLLTESASNSNSNTKSASDSTSPQLSSPSTQFPSFLESKGRRGSKQQFHTNNVLTPQQSTETDVAVPKSSAQVSRLTISGSQSETHDNNSVSSLLSDNSDNSGNRKQFPTSAGLHPDLVPTTFTTGTSMRRKNFTATSSFRRNKGLTAVSSVTAPGTESRINSNQNPAGAIPTAIQPRATIIATSGDSGIQRQNPFTPGGPTVVAVTVTGTDSSTDNLAPNFHSTETATGTGRPNSHDLKTIQISPPPQTQPALEIFNPIALTTTESTLVTTVVTMATKPKFSQRIRIRPGSSPTTTETPPIQTTVLKQAQVENQSVKKSPFFSHVKISQFQTFNDTSTNTVHQEPLRPIATPTFVSRVRFRTSTTTETPPILLPIKVSMVMNHTQAETSEELSFPVRISPLQVLNSPGTASNAAVENVPNKFKFSNRTRFRPSTTSTTVPLVLPSVQIAPVFSNQQQIPLENAKEQGIQVQVSPLQPISSPTTEKLATADILPITRPTQKKPAHKVHTHRVPSPPVPVPSTDLSASQDSEVRTIPSQLTIPSHLNLLTEPVPVSTLTFSEPSPATVAKATLPTVPTNQHPSPWAVQLGNVDIDSTTVPQKRPSSQLFKPTNRKVFNRLFTPRSHGLSDTENKNRLTPIPSGQESGSGQTGVPNSEDNLEGVIDSTTTVPPVRKYIQKLKSSRGHYGGHATVEKLVTTTTTPVPKLILKRFRRPLTTRNQVADGEETVEVVTPTTTPIPRRSLIRNRYPSRPNDLEVVPSTSTTMTLLESNVEVVTTESTEELDQQTPTAPTPKLLRKPNRYRIKALEPKPTLLEEVVPITPEPPGHSVYLTELTEVPMDTTTTPQIPKRTFMSTKFRPMTTERSTYHELPTEVTEVPVAMSKGVLKRRLISKRIRPITTEPSSYDQYPTEVTEEPVATTTRVQKQKLISPRIRPITTEPPSYHQYPAQVTEEPVPTTTRVPKRRLIPTRIRPMTTEPSVSHEYDELTKDTVPTTRGSVPKRRLIPIRSQPKTTEPPTYHGYYATEVTEGTVSTTPRDTTPRWRLNQSRLQPSRDTQYKPPATVESPYETAPSYGFPDEPTPGRISRPAEIETVSAMRTPAHTPGESDKDTLTPAVHTYAEPTATHYEVPASEHYSSVDAVQYTPSITRIPAYPKEAPVPASYPTYNPDAPEPQITSTSTTLSSYVHTEPTTTTTEVSVPEDAYEHVRYHDTDDQSESTTVSYSVPAYRRNPSVDWGKIATTKATPRAPAYSRRKITPTSISTYDTPPRIPVQPQAPAKNQRRFKVPATFTTPVPTTTQKAIEDTEASEDEENYDQYDKEEPTQFGYYDHYKPGYNSPTGYSHSDVTEDQETYISENDHKETEEETRVNVKVVETTASSVDTTLQQIRPLLNGTRRNPTVFQGQLSQKVEDTRKVFKGQDDTSRNPGSAVESNRFSSQLPPVSATHPFPSGSSNPTTTFPPPTIDRRRPTFSTTEVPYLQVPTEQYLTPVTPPPTTEKAAVHPQTLSPEPPATATVKSPRPIRPTVQVQVPMATPTSSSWKEPEDMTIPNQGRFSVPKTFKFSESNSNLLGIPKQSGNSQAHLSSPAVGHVDKDFMRILPNVGYSPVEQAAYPQQSRTEQMRNTPEGNIGLGTLKKPISATQPPKANENLNGPKYVSITNPQPVANGNWNYRQNPSQFNGHAGNPITTNIQRVRVPPQQMYTNLESPVSHQFQPRPLPVSSSGQFIRPEQIRTAPPQRYPGQAVINNLGKDRPHTYPQGQPQAQTQYSSNQFNPMGYSGSPVQFQQSQAPPHYVREYRQHHAIAQGILAKMQNTVRTSRSANLTEAEIAALVEIANRNGSLTSLTDNVKEVEEITKEHDLTGGIVGVNIINGGNDTMPISVMNEAVSLEHGGNGTFKAPATVQKGFFPIVPYSEKDPGLALVKLE